MPKLWESVDMTRMFVSVCMTGRVRTRDGRYYQLIVHPYFGCPELYRDRAWTRRVDEEEWHDDKAVMEAVDWWLSKYWAPTQQDRNEVPVLLEVPGDTEQLQPSN
jgi:hypothetical protein